MPRTDPAAASSLQQRLAACRDAEDWFRELDVPFDPQVLNVGRLHVMRLFGRELEALTGDGADAGALRERTRAALRRAYGALVTASPLEHRVFKVLQDRAPGQFVPLSQVHPDLGDGA
ncbi:MAG TPA: nitrogenase-stabilizing/protective protein NifW [Kineosporiaceae bacterium]